MSTMANKNSETPPYIRRPLYVYDLPSEILHSLTQDSTNHQLQETGDEPDPASTSRQTNTNDDGVSISTSCALCKATFRDVSEQREHVRSDQHKYNLRLSVKGLPPVDEAAFLKQIGDLDESISGSDSSDSDTEDEAGGGQNQDSMLAALLRRQAKVKEEHVPGSSNPKRIRGPGNAPMLWMKSPKVGDEVGLGVYRALLSNEEQEESATSLVDIIKRKQVTPVRAKGSSAVHSTNPGKGGDPHFFLCMIGGGHFAAAIIGLAPEVRKGPGGMEERHALVKAHKTFHRYTTRRKQGGSQSANDNAKGNAHSAGSSIRRYNEAALEADVRNVLSEWRNLIDTAELLFIRATGSTNRRTLMGPYDGQVLRTNDKRLRGFPFSTRRATQNELLRSFQELTRIKISITTQEDEEEIRRQQQQEADKAAAQAAKKQAQATKSAPLKLSPEQEAATLHTSQLQNLIRRSKAPAVLLYLSKNSLSANFEFCPPEEATNHHSPRPLHLAASHNAAAVVTALLTKADADPTIKNVDGRTAYEIAGDSRTRDAFRTARHQLGESSFDWSSARVPAALNPAEAEAKSKREQEEAKNAELQRRNADLEQIRQEEEQRKLGRLEKKAGVGKSLGNPSSSSVVAEKSGAEKREEETRGLTPELRQRLERERRARAAEARIKAMSGAK